MTELTVKWKLLDGYCAADGRVCGEASSDWLDTIYWAYKDFEREKSRLFQLIVEDCLSYASVDPAEDYGLIFHVEIRSPEILAGNYLLTARHVSPTVRFYKRQD